MIAALYLGAVSTELSVGLQASWKSRTRTNLQVTVWSMCCQAPCILKSPHPRDILICSDLEP
jgi:hypothetical protein